MKKFWSMVMILFIFQMFLPTGFSYGAVDEEAMWEMVAKYCPEQLENYEEYNTYYVIDTYEEVFTGGILTGHKFTLKPKTEQADILWQKYSEKYDKRASGYTIGFEKVIIGGEEMYEVTVYADKKDKETPTTSKTQLFLLYHKELDPDIKNGAQHLKNEIPCPNCSFIAGGKKLVMDGKEVKEGVPVYHRDVEGSKEGHNIIASETKGDTQKEWLENFPCDECSTINPGYTKGYPINGYTEDKPITKKYSVIVCHDISVEPKCKCKDTESEKDELNTFIADLKMREAKEEVTWSRIDLKPQINKVSCLNKQSFVSRENYPVREETARCEVQYAEVFWNEISKSGDRVLDTFYMPVPVINIDDGENPEIPMPGEPGTGNTVDLYFIRAATGDTTYFTINPYDNIMREIINGNTDLAAKMAGVDGTGQIIYDTFTPLNAEFMPGAGYWCSSGCSVVGCHGCITVGMPRGYTPKTCVLVGTNSLDPMQAVVININYHFYALDFDVNAPTGEVTDQTITNSDTVQLALDTVMPSGIIPAKAQISFMRKNPEVFGENQQIYVGKNDFIMTINSPLCGPSSTSHYVKLANVSDTVYNNYDFKIIYNGTSVTDKEFIALTPSVTVDLVPESIERIDYNGNSITWQKEGSGDISTEYNPSVAITPNSKETFKLVIRCSDGSLLPTVTHYTTPQSPIPWTGGGLVPEESLRIVGVRDIRWNPSEVGNSALVNKEFYVTNAAAGDILRPGDVGKENPLMGYAVDFKINTANNNSSILGGDPDSITVPVSINPSALKDGVTGASLNDYMTIKISSNNYTNEGSNPDFQEKLDGREWSFNYRLPPIVTYSSSGSKPDTVHVTFGDITIEYAGWGTVHYKNWAPAAWQGGAFVYNGSKGVIDDVKTYVSY